MKELPFNPDGWSDTDKSKLKKYQNDPLLIRLIKIEEDVVKELSKAKERLLVEVLEVYLGRVPTIKDIVERCRKDIYPHPKDEEVIYIDYIPVLWLKTEIKDGKILLTYRK